MTARYALVVTAMGLQAAVLAFAGAVTTALLALVPLAGVAGLLRGGVVGHRIALTAAWLAVPFWLAVALDDGSGTLRGVLVAVALVAAGTLSVRIPRRPAVAGAPDDRSTPWPPGWQRPQRPGHAMAVFLAVVGIASMATGAVVLAADEHPFAVVAAAWGLGMCALAPSAAVRWNRTGEHTADGLVFRYQTAATVAGMTALYAFAVMFTAIALMSDAWPDIAFAAVVAVLCGCSAVWATLAGFWSRRILLTPTELVYVFGRTRVVAPWSSIVGVSAFTQYIRGTPVLWLRLAMNEPPAVRKARLALAPTPKVRRRRRDTTFDLPCTALTTDPGLVHRAIAFYLRNTDCRPALLTPDAIDVAVGSDL